MANNEWRISGGVGNSAFAVRHSPFAIVRGLPKNRSIRDNRQSRWGLYSPACLIASLFQFQAIVFGASCKNGSSIIVVSDGPLPGPRPAWPRPSPKQGGATEPLFEPGIRRDAHGPQFRLRLGETADEASFLQRWSACRCGACLPLPASWRGGKFREPKFPGRGLRDESRIEPLFASEGQSSPVCGKLNCQAVTVRCSLPEPLAKMAAR
jgi:hypothetical protein